MWPSSSVPESYPQCGASSESLGTSGFSASDNPKTTNVQKSNRLKFFELPYKTGQTDRLYKVNVLLDLPEPLTTGDEDK